MLKKLIISSVILATTANLAFAANYRHKYQNKVNYPEHPYKGEVVKHSPPSYKMPAVTPPPPPTTDPFPCSTYTINPGPYVGFNPGLRTNYNQTGSSYKGVEATLFAGYAMLNASFYLGSEIFLQHSAQLQNYANNVNANGNTIGLRTTWGTGFSVLPGFVVADSLMTYLRLGVIRTHFKDIAETATGGQLGAGLQGTVSENWDLRAEYVYSFYQSLTGLGNVRSDQFRLGLVYKLWG